MSAVGDIVVASSFSWLDYSTRDREKALEVIDLFKEPGTLDELGIGTVRDALSDRLFPGISTIQTRAKYFLFVPWIYLRLERRRIGSRDIAQKARQEEIRLIEALSQSEDTNGLIGIEARKRLQRLPSVIYWNGLGVWGLRRYRGSQAQYHRSLDAFYRSVRRPREAGEEEIADRVPSNWHPAIPPPPADFPRQASFALTADEAQFLQERILAVAPHTLLAYLVSHARPGQEARYPWQHPQLADLPGKIRIDLDHAHNFSLSMHGAALLYNLMLAEALGSEQWTEQYLDRFTHWAEEVQQSRTVLDGWSREEFWNLVLEINPRIPFPSRRFIDRWLDMVAHTADPVTLAKNEGVRAMLAERERSLKGPRARLYNRRALELWSGESGTRRLSFRWPQASIIIEDILRGLS